MDGYVKGVCMSGDDTMEQPALFRAVMQLRAALGSHTRVGWGWGCSHNVMGGRGSVPENACPWKHVLIDNNNIENDE